MNILNNFNIKIIENELKINLIKYKINTAPVSISTQYILEFEYSNVKLYEVIEIYNDEKDKVKMLIEKIKSNIDEYDRMKNQKWERVKFTIHIIRAIETRGNIKENAKDYLKLRNKLGFATLRTCAREYMDAHIKKNKNQTYKEVYNHCMNNFIDDAVKRYI